MSFPHACLGLGLLLAGAASAQVSVVRCHITYGGETHQIEAQPTAQPYAVPTRAVGSYFRVRAVYEHIAPLPLTFKFYVYADRDEAPVIIQQANWFEPGKIKASTFGFTGQQFVYETMRDGELQYWCESLPRPGGKR